MRNVVALMIALAPGAAAAGWQDVEWGMSQRQVVKLLDSEVRYGEDDLTLGADITVMGEPAELVLYFKDGELVGMAVSAPSSEVCPLYLGVLNNRYGSPVRHSESDRSIMSDWHDVDADRKVGFLWSKRNNCIVTYEPIPVGLPPGDL